MGGARKTIKALTKEALKEKFKAEKAKAVGQGLQVYTKFDSAKKNKAGEWQIEFYAHS